MIVLLDGEGAEAALINVATAVIMLVVAADMSGEQPHHVGAEIAVVAGPEGEVEMVGHQAIGEQTHGEAFSRLAQQFDEGGEVAVFLEDGASGVAAVEDVVAVAALASSWVAWHEEDYGEGAARRQGKVRCPLFSPLISMHRR